MQFGERQPSPYRAPLSLLLSFFVHGIAALILAIAFHFSIEPIPPTRRKTSTRNLKVRVVSENNIKKKKKKKLKDNTVKYQIVSAPKPDIEETPDDPSFADRYASKVEKQTAKKGAEGSAIIANVLSNAPKTAPPKEKKGSEKQNIQVEKREKIMESLADSKGRKPREKQDGVVIKKTQDEKKGKNKLDSKSLFPQLSNATSLNPLGVGGSSDYLRDVDEGSKTLLNRKRTRYWAFFDRLKKRIQREWKPNREYRNRDPYGDVYGVKDRYSVVNVVLNSDGSIRRLYVQRESGVEFLDNAAVRAIRKASPFYNPPEGLKDEDGYVHFSFGFYLEISTGRMKSLNIFR